MDPSVQVFGAEKLIAVLGYWPSFHDAEVVWMRLDRSRSHLGPGPTAEAAVHTFEMTNEVDAQGFYVLRHHVLVHLRFAGVTILKLDGFNHQNTVFGLSISITEGTQADPIYQVVFDPSYGVAAELQCMRIEVVSVSPCDRHGQLLPAG